MTSGRTARVLIEAGRKWVFASALDWPGWSRPARTEQLALAALADYQPRYAIVASRAGLTLPAAGFTIVFRVPGVCADADFGSVGKAAECEFEAVGAEAGHRLAGLLEACWDEFDRAAAAAPTAPPRGPRERGRDIGEIIGHVLEAEALYAARIGLRITGPGPAVTSAITAAQLKSAEVLSLRARIAAVIRSGSEPGASPERRWPLRYAARRVGWHVLDHAWGLADNSAQAG